MDEPQAIFFSLEGVLGNFKDLDHKAFNAALAEFGYSPRLDLDDFTGMSIHQKISTLAERNEFISRDSAQELFVGFHEYSMVKLTGEEPELRDNVRIEQTIDHFFHSGHLLAIVTNYHMQAANALFKLTGLSRNMFEFIITPGDVDWKAKPSSAGYIKAKLDLGLSSKDVFVVEGTHNGARAARNAMLPYWRVRDFNILSVDSLENVIEQYGRI